jgi:hypothetical protein
MTTSAESDGVTSSMSLTFRPGSTLASDTEPGCALKLLRGEAEGMSIVGTAGPTGIPPELRDALKAIIDGGRLEARGLEMFKCRLRQVTTKNVLIEKQHLDAVNVSLAG